MGDLDLTAVHNALTEEMKKAGNKNNGWIPCSKRLPEDTKTKIVTLKQKTFLKLQKDTEDCLVRKSLTQELRVRYVLM